MWMRKNGGNAFISICQCVKFKLDLKFPMERFQIGMFMLKTKQIRCYIDGASDRFVAITANRITLSSYDSSGESDGLSKRKTYKKFVLD